MTLPVATSVHGHSFNLLVAIVMPLLLGSIVLLVRRFARRTLERSDMDDAEKVHRLRIAQSVLGFLGPMAVILMLTVSGFIFLPVYLWERATGQALTDTQSGWLTAVVLVPAFVAALFFIFQPVVTAYRQIREIEKAGWRRRLRLLRGALIMIPVGLMLPLLREGLGGGPVAHFGSLIIFMVLMGAAIPLVIRFSSPLAELPAERRDRFLRLCERAGVRVRDIHVIDSRREKVANALIAGIVPRWRRIFITNYLMDEFSDDEIEAVLAHEIGHGKHHHTLIKIGPPIAIFGLWMTLPSLQDAAGGVSPALRTALAIALPLLLLAVHFTLIGNVSIKLEYKADEYAAGLVGVDAMKRALMKLADTNMAKRKTGRIWNVLSQHPAIDDRIQRLDRRGLPRAPSHAAHA
jgi:Zn-dependent protease with chaperone function